MASGMALITNADLRNVSLDRAFRKSASVTRNASDLLREQAGESIQNDFDVFLSHSYRDARTIEADKLLRLKVLLESHGLSVYVDWIVDRTVSRDRVTTENAAVIRSRMNHSRSLIYVTSATSSESKWMPWELGYKDGKNGRVAILPVVDQRVNSYHGQEYLGLYPFVTRETNVNGQMRLWLRRNDGSYVELSEWIRTGRQPFRRAS
jgi:hypothetical protein